MTHDTVTVALCERELMCLACVAVGLTDKEIARRLGLSPRTVGECVAKTVRRLNAANRAHAIFIACRANLLDGVG
jgi:DNA-binding NarL/FixJ family response regulator